MQLAKSKRNKFLIGLVYIIIGLLIANYVLKGLIFSNITLLLVIIVISVTALLVGIFVRKN